MVAFWTTTIKDTGSNLHEIIKNTETKAYCCTVLYVLLFREFESVVFNLEVYKMVKILEKELNISRFEPTSFKVNVHEATTELPDSVHIIINTTVLNKIHFNVTLARPALINCCTFSVGRNFPPKINDDCLPWPQSPNLFYGLT